MSHTGRPSVELTFKRIARAPVFTITRRTFPPTGRSVGFVFDRLPDKRYVLCTAGHALYPEDDPAAYRFGLLNVVTELQIERYLMPLKPADDIAFLIAKSIEGFDPIIFGRPKNERFLPRALYNAKNELGSGGPPLTLGLQENTIKIHDDVVMAPPWRVHKSQRSSSAKILSLKEEDQIKKLEGDGWAKMSCMTLYSRPGFSGSPIWDDRWNLYGMGVRGNKGTPETEKEPDLLAYYTASALDRCWREVKTANGI